MGTACDNHPPPAQVILRGRSCLILAVAKDTIVTTSTLSSGIRDNHTHGRVGDFLRDKIESGSKLSVVSAYFTIYAYESLKNELDGINSLWFLFGEPRFVQSLDPGKVDKKSYNIEDDGLKLANRLEQRRVAKG